MGARHVEDRGDETAIETTFGQHWQVGARHAEDGGDEKKMETTLAQQFDFVLQAMRAAQASRRQSVQNSPKRKALSDVLTLSLFILATATSLPRVLYASQKSSNKMLA